MGRHGFIFSLDAFVAFTLIMVTIGFLIFTIGTPKPFYSSLEQAHQLASDTLNVLAASSDGAGQETYLERILNDPANADYAGSILKKVAGGNSTDYPNTIIPKGYGYRLERYGFNSTGPGDWVVIYDAGADGGSDRAGRNFTKVQASATIFASLYAVSPKPGESPFCYLSCTGYDPSVTGEHHIPCNVTPCNAPTSNFNAGANSISLVRLVVYA